MTSNVSSENCHYFDVYMEHEEHVYFRKDRSVQQGVVREGAGGGCAPSRAEREAKGNFC